MLVHTVDTDKSRLSCLVRVGGVKRIDDKSGLSATENFKTILSSLEMWCEQSFVLSRPSLNLQLGLVCKLVYTTDRTGQNCSVSNILRTTENSLDLSLVLFTLCLCRWRELGIMKLDLLVCALTVQVNKLV